MRRAMLPLFVLPLAACGEASPETLTATVIDTLESGVIVARNDAEGAWSAQGTLPWTLVEDLRIGRIEGDGPDVFGSAVSLIPDDRGRMWVLDYQASELRLFDADGTFVRSVGGPGQGPGEFGFNPCAEPGPDGEIWVEAGRRWQRFDTAGVLLGGQPSTTLGCGVSVWRGEELVAAITQFNAETRERSGSFVLHDRTEVGDIVVRDTIATPTLPERETFEWHNEAGRPVIIGPVPLTHGPTYVLSPLGVLWVSDGGGEYRLRRQTLEGDTLLIVEREYEPVPVPDDLRAAEIRELDRESYGLPDDFDADRIPRFFPPFDGVYHALDDALWVRRQVEGGAHVMDVFDARGVYLGPVAMPEGTEDMIIHEITATHLYGVVRDEYDVSYVVRLRIER